MDEQEERGAAGPSPADQPATGAGLGVEIVLVFALSLGQSAVYAVVSLIAKLTAGPLNQAKATLNASASTRQWLDLTYQLLNIGFNLVPVALALFLVRVHRPPGTLGGFDLRRPWPDLGLGVGLAAVIGVPGIGLYFAGRALGVTATVVPSALGEYWWTVPVLVLSAMQNAILEEVLVVGYLFTRLRQLQWQPAAVLATSALLRGSYHLYQGFGPFVANAAMGVIFGLVYLRTRRVMPLVVAHTLLDVVAFVGYALFASTLHLPG